MNFKNYIREIPDYPKPGINFKDITTLVGNSQAFSHLVDTLYVYAKKYKVTKVVSLESRGFIVGGALAYHLGAGFVPVRKKGKLPYKTISQEYELEYGTDVVEIHKDALTKNDVVLIHDDLLATGGTANAALELVETFNVKKVVFSFICDLSFIKTDQKRKIFSYDNAVLVNY